MTTPPTANTPIHPLVWGALAVFVVGLISWLWTGEWRWALTGIGVGLLVAIAANVRRT